MSHPIVSEVDSICGLEWRDSFDEIRNRCEELTFALASQLVNKEIAEKVGCSKDRAVSLREKIDHTVEPLHTICGYWGRGDARHGVDALEAILPDFAKLDRLWDNVRNGRIRDGDIPSIDTSDRIGNWHTFYYNAKNLYSVYHTFIPSLQRTWEERKGKNSLSPVDRLAASLTDIEGYWHLVNKGRDLDAGAFSSVIDYIDQQNIWDTEGAERIIVKVTDAVRRVMGETMMEAKRRMDVIEYGIAACGAILSLAKKVGSRPGAD